MRRIGTALRLAVVALALSAAAGATMARAAPPVAQRPAATSAAEDTSATATAWSVRVIGASVKKLPIRAWRFGTGTRRLLVIGGVHGNELGDDVAFALVRYLQANPSAVPSGTEIHIIPRLNPDGARRNARGNVHKVDLNRNMPTSDWRRRLDRRDLSGRLHLSGGVRPGSEPETRALLGYTRETTFAVMVSLHSRAGLIDFAGRGARPIAARISAACGLRLGVLSYERYIHGAMGRYFSQVLGVPAITIELKRGVLTGGLRRGILASLG
jgi:predicted deacylase